MGHKISLFIVALLGFSTACSSVGRSRATSDSAKQDSLSALEQPRLQVMYGVPYQDFSEKEKAEAKSAETTSTQDDADTQKTDSKEGE